MRLKPKSIPCPSIRAWIKDDLKGECGTPVTHRMEGMAPKLKRNSLRSRERQGQGAQGEKKMI